MKRTPLIVVLGLSFSLTSCIKTRAQLRGEDAEVGSIQPAPQQNSSQVLADELRSEITRLSARIEDLERAQKQVQGDLKASKEEDHKKLEARIIDLEQAQLQMLEAMKKMDSKPTAVSAEDAEDTLGAAKKKLKQGHHNEAIKLFNSYLQSPKPAAEVEATFLLGEAYFESKQYNKAILEFDKISRKKGGQSSFIPKALYYIGLSFEGLGNPSDSVSFYEELVDKYPKTKEAQLAKNKLKTPAKKTKKK